MLVWFGFGVGEYDEWKKRLEIEEGWRNEEMRGNGDVVCIY